MQAQHTAAPTRDPAPGDSGRDLDGAKFGLAAAESLRASVAVLDAEGVIRWANEAWTSGELDPACPLLARAGVGMNLLVLCRTEGGPLARAVGAAVTAVATGHSRYVELECGLPHRSDPVRVSISPARDNAGVVVMHIDSDGLAPSAPVASLQADAARNAERLTPREREVLEAMTRGLDNSVIAKELGVEYSTVRGYVQSVLEKLGARSRADAVSRAFRTGIVRL
jgi:DNA-binding CsgD family transcriptional regulator